MGLGDILAAALIFLALDRKEALNQGRFGLIRLSGQGWEVVLRCSVQKERAERELSVLFNLVEARL
jgi:hypothetical protein